MVKFVRYVIISIFGKWIELTSFMARGRKDVRPVASGGSGGGL